ncbi:regulator [Micromonospora sp. WMMC415]|nr:regulator [Micromonospora sp. WMMC415]
MPASTVDTLDAFTDTLIPGAKRFPGDVAVAGVATGPGGADAGFLTLLTDPRVGARPLLPAVAALLNARAWGYALSQGSWPTPRLPAFVALSYRHRSAVVARLFQRDDPDRDLWAVLALASGLAFDAAAHLPTAQAVRDRHPGLAVLRFPPPDPDGFWRHPESSYRLVLADRHPDTTPEGNPR